MPQYHFNNQVGYVDSTRLIGFHCKTGLVPYTCKQFVNQAAFEHLDNVYFDHDDVYNALPTFAACRNVLNEFMLDDAPIF